MTKSALLVLEDGTVFRGTAIGAEGVSVGEVVFNTSMTGYQEILTDPSYAEQMVTLTYPHIGNTGTNDEDEESGKVWAKGLIIRDLPLLASNFRNQRSLSQYLKDHNILGIADIDTRKLTRILREKGAQNGCLMAGDIDEARNALRYCLTLMLILAVAIDIGLIVLAEPLLRMQGLRGASLAAGKQYLLFAQIELALPTKCFYVVFFLK